MGGWVPKGGSPQAVDGAGQDGGFVMVRTPGGVYRMLDPLEAALAVARREVNYFPPPGAAPLHGGPSEPSH